MKKTYIYKWLDKALMIVSISTLCLLWTGCNDDEANSIGEDPYAGGREPLVVKLVWLSIVIRKKINMILNSI